MSNRSANNGSVSDQDLLISGWFDHHPMNFMQAKLRASVNDEIKAYLGYSWPFSNSYFNPMGGVFLPQLRKEDLLSEQAVWLVRDGRVPLLWFFRTYPVPKNVKAKLLIDEDCLACVPNAWLEHVGTYRLIANGAPATHPRVAVVGIACESFCSLRTLQRLLDRMRDSEGESLKNRVDIFAPVRLQGGEESEHSFFGKFYRELFCALPNARMLTYSEMLGTSDPQNLRVYDLNDKMLIADNFILHELMRKGAGFYDHRPVAANEEYIPVSNFHGFAVRTHLQRSEKSDNGQVLAQLKRAELFDADLGTALNSHVFRQMPWPKWFPKFVESIEPNTWQTAAGTKASSLPNVTKKSVAAVKGNGKSRRV